MQLEGEQIFGLVDKLLFQNIETGFCIAILKPPGKTRDVVIKGVLHGISVGQKISATGVWVQNEKFGLQFQASSFQFSLPDDRAGIEKYLGSGFIKGIGKTLASRLVARFGEKTLEVLDSNPTLVSTVSGIGQAKAASICQAWKQQQEISRIMVFLRLKEVPVWLASKIYSRYGDQSIQKVSSDPYSLADEIWGVGFKTADDLAVKLGLNLESPKRIKSAIVSVLKEIMQSGDLYLPLQALIESSIQLLKFDLSWAQKIEKFCFELVENGKLCIIFDGQERIASLAFAHGAERGIANRIGAINSTKSSIKFDHKKIFDDLTVNIKKFGFSENFELSQAQVDAILTAFESKVCIITGGPGTGKTTLLKALCGVLKTNGIKFKVAAPTGRAAKRVAECAYVHALTLHRLLEYDPTIGKFGRNDQNILPFDFIIVDEASMIDVFLASGLLKALGHQCCIVFLGDVDQLPPVGPGNFLTDLINSGQIKTIRLNNIFRQASGSSIVLSAHAINSGNFPEYQSQAGLSDFVFLKQVDSDNILNVLSDIYFNVLPKHKINPKNWIVLGPMHKGAAGCQAMNAHLQAIINPVSKSGPGILIFGQEFRPFDRVMQIKNNYDKNVFNGDIGYVKAVDTGNRALSVVFGETEHLYKAGELDQLTLSYAISIHKSQGSEFEAVTIPIFTQHFVMLSRPLIYTAVTRAKKLCIVVGQTRAFAIAIKNAKTSNRKTYLADLLSGKVLKYSA